MRKVFVGIVVLAGLALGSGCIGVSANETSVSPKYQVAVVDAAVSICQNIGWARLGRPCPPTCPERS